MSEAGHVIEDAIAYWNQPGVQAPNRWIAKAVEKELRAAGLLNDAKEDE